MRYAIWLHGKGWLRGADIFVFEHFDFAQAVLNFYGKSAEIVPIDNPQVDADRLFMNDLEKALLEQEENKERQRGLFRFGH